MISKHPDAVGYLNDLAREVGEMWFEKVCDLVILSGASSLDGPTLNALFGLFVGTESYVGIREPKAAVSPALPTPSVGFIERLSGFHNFKLLRDTLRVNFEKRITLIFGASGSGKSSLCESLKLLATHKQPSRPVENVRADQEPTPEFRYKFRGDAVDTTWTPAAGFGALEGTVKYFDAEVAIGNVQDAVEPGRVITLAPFDLHVFDWAKSLTAEFRESLQRVQLQNAESLPKMLEEVRADFSAFKSRPLSVVDQMTAAVLSAEIGLGEAFVDDGRLAELQSQAEELRKAASGDGLRLLRAEHRELESFLASLGSFLGQVEKLWALEPAKKAADLADRRAAQESLASILIPTGGTLDSLLTLLRPASLLCKLDDASGQDCPLCKRGLGAPEVGLFRRYFDLLDGKLQTEISALEADVASAEEIGRGLAGIDRGAWGKFETIAADVLAEAREKSGLVAAECIGLMQPSPDARAALKSLRALEAALGGHLGSKRTAIDLAANGADALSDRLGKLLAEIEPLEYAQAIARSLEKLKKAREAVEWRLFWDSRLSAFPQLLKRITLKAKEAYEELVVADFESRLNAEYVALAERDMAAFGVKLSRKGSEAAVTVSPQIGGRGIDGVLSEGEQRLHALALFFAELESSAHSVLVFDDPVSSFDYNYIANYCIRLKEFARKHTSVQIIVLTHNWEFFVQLQTTLNKNGLDSQLSVQVLESCSVVAEYSERIETLKKEIEDVLSLSGEPTKLQKEDLAGDMRRLIEAVVNTHVFCDQRHQFKQKSQQITAFDAFTKVVALLPAEAVALRDLYAKLSPPEHDDPSNAFVNIDKAMFRTRYNKILEVEAAIMGRKP
jgi:energy-coupling factor transporter ATP-binding protein EcfA2